MAVHRVARQALGIGHQVVGYRGHRAIEHFGETVVRVQLLPELGGRNAAREPVHDDQLLPDVERALQ